MWFVRNFVSASVGMQKKTVTLYFVNIYFRVLLCSVYYCTLKNLYYVAALQKYSSPAQCSEQVNTWEVFGAGILLVSTETLTEVSKELTRAKYLKYWLQRHH